MTGPDARAAVAAAKAPIGDLGGAWMVGEAEERATSDAGLAGWQLYFLARHGVLGDVDADVVTAVACFFPAGVVRENWEAARATLTPEQAVERYLALLRGWGRQRLTGFDGVDRLCALAQKLVDGADVTGLPLFAGWRAVPLPDDAPARCVQLMHVLREHRGSCHAVAVVASRLPPLTAILANVGGEANARDYGWQPPFPDVTDADRALRARAEGLTDDLATPAYAALDQGEREELLALLTAAHARAFGH